MVEIERSECDLLAKSYAPAVGDHMKYDQDKVDEMTLALLYLVTSSRKEGLGARAWRGHDSSTINRLHEKGWIKDPKTKDMSLYFTEEGFKKSEELFQKHFGSKEK